MADGPAGPGKFSKRTDRQPIATPRLDDPNTKFGEVQASEEAQRIAPVPKGQAQQATSRVRPGGGGGEGIPSFLTEMPSQFPGEPVTTGLDMGPGMGSEALQVSQEPQDDREAVLFYLATTFQNEDALAELRDYREARAQRAEAQALSPMPTSPLGAPGGPPPVPVEPDEDFDDLMAFGPEGVEEEPEVAAQPAPAGEAGPITGEEIA